MIITHDQLRAIAGVPVNEDVVNGIIQFLPQVLANYEINTQLRVAHFLAQAAHESDHFHTLMEYASGAAYEGRKDLGNTHEGDGRRFRGRGIFQITGRANYKTYGDLIEVDIVSNPSSAATPEISCWTAGAYWDKHGLNTLADADDVKGITHRINGGYNGLDSRKAMLVRAKSVAGSICT